MAAGLSRMELKLLRVYLKNLGVYPNEVTPTQKLRVNVSFPFTSVWWFFPLKSPWQFDYHLDLRLKHVQPTSMPAYHGPAQGSSWILCMTCERFSKLYIYILCFMYSKPGRPVLFCSVSHMDAVGIGLQGLQGWHMNVQGHTGYTAHIH